MSDNNSGMLSAVKLIGFNWVQRCKYQVIEAERRTKMKVGGV